MDTSLIVTIGGVVAATTTVVVTSGKVAKYISKRIGRYAVNQIRKTDIEDSSYIGQALAFNDQINDSLLKINETMQGMQQELANTRIDSLRIELLQLIHNTPEKAEVIEAIYQKYVDMGGNSYVSQVIQEWREIYGRDVIRKRIKKK